MKPFDLKAAQQGAAIRTRDGQPAEFVGLARSATQGPRVFAVVAGHVLTYLEDGTLEHKPTTGDNLVLVMAPRVAYVNLLDDGSGEHFPTVAAAQESARGYKPSALLAVGVAVELSA